jgi:hypothetical protein
MKESRLKSILQEIGPVNRMVIRWKERERKVLYGDENPDKTFFVIRRNAPNAGLFSFVITNMGWIRYALDRGYIPVIDMQYYYNTYLTEDEVRHVNAWDYYFLQPCGYSLEDIMKSKNVIISSLNAAENNPNPLYLDEMKEWIRLAHEVLHFKPEVQHIVEEQREKLFQNERVLGVLCRGTDYTALRPKGHPIQPDVGAVIAKAQEMMQDQHCTTIFLATEDETIYQLFLAAFGNRLRTYSERIRTTNGIFINEYEDQKLEKQSDPAKAKYLRGLNYAVTIGLLSSCNCLVAGQVSGTTGAILLSKGYEKVYLFDLGNYS